MKALIKINSLLVCFLFLLCSSPASAKDSVRIVDIAPMNSEHELLLYFSLRDAFTDEMIKGIENGVPVTFSFFVELHRFYDGDAERKIASRAFDHTLSYDPIKQEYTVEREERGVPVAVFRNFTEAKSAMNDINDLRLTDLSQLEMGGRYLVKVKAKLAKKDLPMNFQYIIPFWQLWKFETDWHSLSFIYGNSGSAFKR